MSLDLKDNIVSIIKAKGEGLLSVANKAFYTIFIIELIIKSKGSR
jgi:hypothetical protein